MTSTTTDHHDQHPQGCITALEEYIAGADPTASPPTCGSPLMADLARHANDMQQRLDLAGALPPTRELLQDPGDDTQRLVALARTTGQEWAPLLTEHLGQPDRAHNLRNATTVTTVVSTLYALSQARLGPDARTAQSALDIALQLYTRALDTTPHPTSALAKLTINVVLSLDAILDIPFDTSMHDLLTQLARQNRDKQATA